MRYLVSVTLKPNQSSALLESITTKTLGKGSVAGTEYLKNMDAARLMDDFSIRWVEVCYCAIPLQEEQPYWQEYFNILEIKNAHDPLNCRDLNKKEPWACGSCDCTYNLEQQLKNQGSLFLDELQSLVLGKKKENLKSKILPE